VLSSPSTERLAAHVFDGFGGVLGLGAHQVASHTGVDIDHRDAVGDEVVQLARDAQPFLGDPSRGHLVPGLLRAAGTFLNLGDVGATDTHRIAGGGGHADPGDRLNDDDVAQVVAAGDYPRQDEQDG